MNKQCLIMLTSYNSEQYIGEQIQSIIEQDYPYWHLVVQDDGSNDRTTEIIREYVLNDCRIELLNNEGKHGAYFNFHSLINKCKENACEYEFYMFSDHDDIWYKNKISRFISFYEENCDSLIPTMLYADMSIVNANGEVISESMDSCLGMKYKNAASTFFCHNVFGCNTFFNQKLFEIVPAVDINDNICEILSHDNYYAKFAACLGKLFFLDEKLMRYRRYGGNVTSNQSYSYGIKRIVSRVLNINNLAFDHARTYTQSIYVLDIISKMGFIGMRKEILDNIRYILCHGGIIGGLKYLGMRISCGNTVKTISHLAVIVTKKYQKYIVLDDYK